MTKGKSASRRKEGDKKLRKMTEGKGREEMRRQH
jgi:hypothetical protein